jgi:polyisoprenoid-binding protein YceI
VTDPTAPPSSAPARRRPLLWIGIGVLVAVILLVGGPFLYINVIKEDAPPPLALPSNTTSTVAGQTTTSNGSSNGGSTDGELAPSWSVVTDGTQVGYRVEEVLLGQSTEAVGRTSDVEGTLEIDGTTVTAVDLTVDMTTVASDSSQRDGQFRGRIMDTDSFPTATFTLTEPIELDAVPADGETVSATATGDLTLKGTTTSVTVELQAQRSGGTLSVQGAIPITFADYGIDNPSGGPAQVGDTGTLEFLVVFQPAT